MFPKNLKKQIWKYTPFGNHDFIVTTEFGDSKTTAANLLEKIHPIEGIIKTRTLIGSDIKSKQI